MQKAIFQQQSFFKQEMKMTQYYVVQVPDQSLAKVWGPATIDELLASAANNDHPWYQADFDFELQLKHNFGGDYKDFLSVYPNYENFEKGAKLYEIMCGKNGSTLSDKKQLDLEFLLDFFSYDMNYAAIVDQKAIGDYKAFGHQSCLVNALIENVLNNSKDEKVAQ